MAHEHSHPVAWACVHSTPDICLQHLQQADDSLNAPPHPPTHPPTPAARTGLQRLQPVGRPWLAVQGAAQQLRDLQAAGQGVEGGQVRETCWHGHNRTKQ